MSKLEKIKVDSLMHRLGLKYNLPDKVIKQIVESPYEFSSGKIKDLDFSEITTEADFNKIKTNFLYRGFGKLFINYLILKRRIDKKSKIILNKHNGRSN